MKSEFEDFESWLEDTLTTLEPALRAKLLKKTWYGHAPPQSEAANAASRTGRQKMGGAEKRVASGSNTKPANCWGKARVTSII